MSKSVTVTHTCDKCDGKVNTGNEYLPRAWAKVNISFTRSDGGTKTFKSFEVCSDCSPFEKAESYEPEQAKGVIRWFLDNFKLKEQGAGE